MAASDRMMNVRGPQIKRPSELLTAQRSREHFDNNVARIVGCSNMSDAKATLFGKRAEAQRKAKGVGSVLDDQPKSLYSELRSSWRRKNQGIEEDNARRWGLRNAPTVREQLQQYWTVVARGPHGASAIDTHQFIHIHRLMSRALLGLQGGWASGSIRFADNEWQHVMGSRKSQMRPYEFYDWLFQVADAWYIYPYKSYPCRCANTFSVGL
jgi:hypothetical protein